MPIELSTFENLSLLRIQRFYERIQKQREFERKEAETRAAEARNNTQSR